MAKTDEEEYLDSLLKSMSMDGSDNTTKKVNDTDIKKSSEELDNFDTLSFDENNNNKEKSKETGSTEDNKPEQEDLDSRILNEMLLNDSKSIPDEAHTEDDNIDKADDNVNETGKDFSKDNTDLMQSLFHLHKYISQNEDAHQIFRLSLQLYCIPNLPYIR